MTEEDIFDAVVRQGVVDFRAVACTLDRQRVPWCVHGGFAVNHYAPPAIYAADLWIVLPFSSLASTLAGLDRQGFYTQAFAASRGIPEPTAHRLHVRFIAASSIKGFRHGRAYFPY